MGEVIATERYGSQESWRYSLKDGKLKRERAEENVGATGNSITAVFKSVFLPQGYPESVSQDYLQYQLWDTVQAFSSSLSGTLATQASLRGVGVGNQEATVAAATVTWLLRDGTGMLGRILFAWLKGNKLDSEAKKWRLVADILNDFAMFMEIAAPHFPPLFMLIVCLAGILKSIVGVAGGATRAALTVHQARRNNMADISAKDGSQETLVNLAGLLFSLVLIPLVTDNPLLTFTLFFFFTVLHLVANYKAVRSVVMETLNEARLSIIFHQYLLDGQLLKPLEANQKEPVFIDFRRKVPMKLGVRLGELAPLPHEMHKALKNNSKPYLIGVLSACAWGVTHPFMTRYKQHAMLCASALCCTTRSHHRKHSGSSQRSRINGSWCRRVTYLWTRFSNHSFMPYSKQNGRLTGPCWTGMSGVWSGGRRETERRGGSGQRRLKCTSYQPVLF